MSIIVVGGALANKPGNGGEAWVRLSWVRGLERLGFDVYLLEELDAGVAVDDEGRPCAVEESVNWRYFQSVTRRFGLAGRSALWDHATERPLGLGSSEVADLSRDAVALVNISGHLTLPRFFERGVRRAYVDLDPGFTQIWADQGVGGARLAGHDVFFTVGENVGRAGCPVPTLGLDWQPVRQPVVLDDWPARDPAACRRFTTVASWRGAFGPVSHGGVEYGVKAHEFRRFLDLPGRVEPEFEIALAIHEADAADRERLARHGWTLVDPRTAASEPESFRDYVNGSDGEFSVAQGVYVGTRSGWFSDRSARYLAAGKPVLLQDTGFSERLPAGEGLVAFSTRDEAAAGARRIAAEYPAHARAARQLAEQYFDSDRVLPDFLDRLGLAA